MKRLFVTLLLLAPVAQADDSPWRLGIAIGYGERSNPLVFADDVPVVLDLDIAYFGEHFFFDNGDLGVTFADNDAVTASAMLRVKSDRVFFSRTNIRFVDIGLTGQPLAVSTQVVVPDRDYAIEAGIELLADGPWGNLQINAFHDVSGTHDGFEVDLAYGTGFRLGERWYVSPGIGITYKSRALNDYYWGIRPGEGNAAVPVYEAGDGINARARVRASYHFSKRWNFSLSVEYERLNDETADSPIVTDPGVTGFFAGLAYRF